MIGLIVPPDQKRTCTGCGKPKWGWHFKMRKHRDGHTQQNTHCNDCVRKRSRDGHHDMRKKLARL